MAKSIGLVFDEMLEMPYANLNKLSRAQLDALALEKGLDTFNLPTKGDVIALIQ